MASFPLATMCGFVYRFGMRDASKISEKSVEGYLYERVNDEGGFCIKLNPLWLIGIPDRLVILYRRIAFCETKRPKGGKLRKIQQKRLSQLLALGAECWVIWSHVDVNKFMCDRKHIGNARHFVSSKKVSEHDK